MSNKKLYIIGNGFDLHHGLETSYATFCQHVKENDRELYEFLEWYVDIELDKDGLWKDFEKSLGTFHHGVFYSDYDHTEPSRGVSHELCKLVIEGLKSGLQPFK